MKPSVIFIVTDTLKNNGIVKRLQNICLKSNKEGVHKPRYQAT